MTPTMLSNTDNPPPQRLYHGTRAELKARDLIEPSHLPGSEQDRAMPYVYLTPHLDAAIWEAELAIAAGPGRVYIVEALGAIEDASTLTDYKSPSHPAMS